MSGEMASISMIVDKHQYYTVMVLDSQACSPRIITNATLPGKIHGHYYPYQHLALIYGDMIIDRRYSPILIELVMVPDSQAWSPRIITNLPICAEIHGPKDMASKILTHHLS